MSNNHAMLKPVHVALLGLGLVTVTACLDGLDKPLRAHRSSAIHQRSSAVPSSVATHQGSSALINCESGEP